MKKRFINYEPKIHSIQLSEDSTGKKDPYENFIVKRKKTDFTPSPEILKLGYQELLELSQKYYSSLEIKETTFSQQQKNVLVDLAGFTKKEEMDIDAFIPLDKYFFKEQEESIKHFSGGINLNTLSLVMCWKLLRGKFRSRLPALIRENTDNQVRLVTKTCFEEVFKVYKNFKKNVKRSSVIFVDVHRAEMKKWVKDLSILRGVGPATASALLSMVCPEIPFMSDEALEASGDLKPVYKAKTLDLYLDFMSSLSVKVNCSQSIEESLSLRDIERALFSFSMTK